ncbi:MAG: glycosyltransferase [Bacteroidales bacterium]
MVKNYLMKDVLFISTKSHINKEKIGGVQLCSFEYIELLEKAGFNVKIQPIEYSANLMIRLKIRFGIDVYNRFRYNKIVKPIITKIKEENIKYVALNQVDHILLAKLLKQEFKKSVKIIVLSHGNESGDYLHQIVKSNKLNNVGKILNIYKLGALLYTESDIFSNDIDLVLSLSETELQINNWLGANHSLFIPRTFKPDFIDWRPVLNKIGFMGTLNHKPNYDGVIMVCEALKTKQINNIVFIILGLPELLGKKIEKEYSFVKYLGYLDDKAMRTEVSSWSLFLNPVFWYSRGASTKLAMAINWGLPVISTIQGNRGYKWESGGILTARNADEMADFISCYANSIEKLGKLKEDIRLAAQSGPDLNCLANQINDILTNGN